jgi:predicted secreted protein
MKTSQRSMSLIVALLFFSSACRTVTAPTSTPSPSPPAEASPTPSLTPPPQASPTPQREQITLSGPDCPNGFDQMSAPSREVSLRAGDTLEVSAGSTPSIPCHWQPPETGESTIVQQVAHESKWPAPDVTPMPGAPGLEIWTFEARKAGRSEIRLACMCLKEEGSQEEERGVFVLEVSVSE